MSFTILTFPVAKVKMSTVHIGWIAIIIAVDVHDPQRMKTNDYGEHALNTIYLLI